MKIDFKRFIQIAGIIDRQEADMLVDCGVNYLGFPLRLPVNKEDLSEEEAAKIIKSLRHPYHGILITYLSTADEIIRFCTELSTNIVQLHGDISTLELLKLRGRNPDLNIIKSLVVHENNADKLEKTVLSAYECVDAFITDTYDPQTGASGATGKTHDWSISRHLVEISPKPVILAGGLNAENVYNAILEVKPAGVDSHTGVEGRDGRKDKQMVTEFVTEANKAFDKI